MSSSARTTSESSSGPIQRWFPISPCKSWPLTNKSAVAKERSATGRAEISIRPLCTWGSAPLRRIPPPLHRQPDEEHQQYAYDRVVPAAQRVLARQRHEGVRQDPD